MYDGRQKSARGQYDDARAQAARRAGHVRISDDRRALPLYPLLHSLEEKELIRSYEKDEGAARPRRYYHLERKGQHLLREKEVEWATFTTAVDRVLKGGVCLGSA